MLFIIVGICIIGFYPLFYVVLWIIAGHHALLDYIDGRREATERRESEERYREVRRRAQEEVEREEADGERLVRPFLAVPVADWQFKEAPTVESLTATVVVGDSTAVVHFMASSPCVNVSKASQQLVSSSQSARLLAESLGTEYQRRWTAVLDGLSALQRPAWEMHVPGEYKTTLAGIGKVAVDGKNVYVDGTVIHLPAGSRAVAGAWQVPHSYYMDYVQSVLDRMKAFSLDEWRTTDGGFSFYVFFKVTESMCLDNGGTIRMGSEGLIPFKLAGEFAELHQRLRDHHSKQKTIPDCLQ